MLRLLLATALLNGGGAADSSCRFEDGVDLRCGSTGPGAGCRELGRVQAADKASCCTACAARTSCTAAVFLPAAAGSEKDACFLKQLQPGVNLSAHREGAVGCVRSGPPAPPAPPPAPLPSFPFRNASLPLEVRVADLLGRLTLPEKILQMTRGGAKSNSPTPSIARLGLLPHIWGSECATGLGSDDGSFAGTSFPQPLGQAATWDRPLIKRVAQATAVELRAQHNEDLRNGVVSCH